MPIRSACLALLAAVLVAAPTAQASSPGKWTQLGDANLRNIDEVTLARTADGVLHAAWTIPAAGNDTLVHSSIAPNGSASAPNVIQSCWASIGAVPDLVASSSGLQLFFGGIRSLDPSDTNDNLNLATAGQMATPGAWFRGPSHRAIRRMRPTWGSPCSATARRSSRLA